MSVPSTEQQSQFDLPENSAQPGFGHAVSEYFNRIKGGDLGALPAVIGIVVLVVIFGIMQSDAFLSEANFANLINQGAAIMVLAIGLVFVLLLGEIDLSAGFTANVGAATLAVEMSKHGWSWETALALTLIVGIVIGLTIAVLVARLGIPSFVVTLAFFLGLQGLSLLIIGEGGTIPIRDETILSVMNKNLSVAAGWAFAVIAVGGYGAASFWGIARRRKAGLAAQATSVWAAKVGALGILVFIATYLLNQERQRDTAIITIQGVPRVVPVVAIIVAGLHFLLTRTAFGRHVYAVGGNEEAARRAGINVASIKTACFVMCSFLAVIAGVLLASRDNSVSPTTGGSQTLLYAVGAAVIGGTSLFGGRGRVFDAVTGGLVIAVIANGLPLVTEKSGTQFIINGLVLLIAASVDAVSRRRAAATGR